MIFFSVVFKATECGQTAIFQIYILKKLKTIVSNINLRKLTI